MSSISPPAVLAAAHSEDVEGCSGVRGGQYALWVACGTLWVVLIIGRVLLDVYIHVHIINLICTF